MVHGRLRLSFERAPEHTVLRVREQQPPLRVVRAFPLDHGETLVHLHNLSGGVLGGDHLEMTVEVGPQAAAQLTSTGATRLYRNRARTPAAHQSIEAKVGENGLLEYLPDPLIPFAGSCYRQQTRIELAPGAGLFWWDTIAPGRDARGELFAYDLLSLELDIAAGGTPIAVERARLEPRRRPLDSLARLGRYRYWACFYICRAGVEPARWLALENKLGALVRQLERPPEVLWAVSTLAGHGLSVRALSVAGREIAGGLVAFWRAAKFELYGWEPVPPRKAGG